MHTAIALIASLIAVSIWLGYEVRQIRKERPMAPTVPPDERMPPRVEL